MQREHGDLIVGQRHLCLSDDAGFFSPCPVGPHKRHTHLGSCRIYGTLVVEGRDGPGPLLHLGSVLQVIRHAPSLLQETAQPSDFHCLTQMPRHFAQSHDFCSSDPSTIFFKIQNLPRAKSTFQTLQVPVDGIFSGVDWSTSTNVPLHPISAFSLNFSWRIYQEKVSCKNMAPASAVVLSALISRRISSLVSSRVGFSQRITSRDTETFNTSGS